MRSKIGFMEKTGRIFVVGIALLIVIAAAVRFGRAAKHKITSEQQVQTADLRETRNPVNAETEKRVPGQVTAVPHSTHANSGTSVSSLQVGSAKQALQAGCYVQRFRHKHVSGHDNREACRNHSNQIELPAKASPRCVSVDGVPVGYKRSGNHLIIAAVAGPESVIEARYCIGKAACPKPCQISRDTFLNALGAVAEPSGDTGSAPKHLKVAHWDPQNHDNRDSDADLDKEVAASLGDADASQTIFKEWISGEAQPCAAAVANR